MFSLFRSRLSAAAIIFAFTVGACCSPSAPTDACTGPSEATTTTQPAGGMDMGQSMGGMPMPDKPTQVCSLFYLTKNDPVPPLYHDIGSAHWHVPWGQDYFDQGLQFFFAFNNRESYRAFRAAADEAESNNVRCSACYWAQALPLGVDINMATQSEYDRQAAKTALHRAIEANPNPEDWAIIQALYGRYQDCNAEDKNDAKKCQKLRNQAYYQGMKRVLEAFGSDDPNIIALFADSAMNMTPWKYWDKDGNPVSEAITEAQTYLEKALSFRQYRRNEGPIHWYIHLMEGSTAPRRAKQYADLLAPPAPWKPLAPNAGHLVHMPSHIYYRIGDMQDAIRANKEAIEADEAYFAQEPDLSRPDGDRYKYGYYPHNIHFLLVAAVLSGDNQRDVDRYAEKLLKSAPDKANGLRADEYRTVYYLARLNFAGTPEIREFAQPNPFDQQPLANLAYDFTQLMADIWDGSNSKRWADEFEGDLDKYRKGASDADKPNASCDPLAPNVQLPRDKDLCLAAILNDLGHARMAALNKKWDEAEAAARHAMAIQDALGYREPPLWLYPTRQTLASVLIRRADADGLTMPKGQEDLKTATQLLLESLNKLPGADPNLTPTGTYPGNGWAYYGLWEIAQRDGSADTKEARSELERHWFGSDKFRNLARM